MNKGYLKRGNYGPGVKQLQETINTYFKGQDPIKVDGYFGPATETAVKRLQKAVFTTVDGVWGAKSNQAIAMIGYPTISFEIDVENYEAKKSGGTFSNSTVDPLPVGDDFPVDNGFDWLFYGGIAAAVAAAGIILWKIRGK